jgi:tetratricopeptide (TPR) repeat protein
VLRSRLVILGAIVILTGGAESLAEQLPRRKPFSSDVIRKEKQTDSFGYPLAAADKVEIVKLLRSADFAMLDRVLNEYERDAEADFHREDWVGSAVEAFAVADPSFQSLLDHWVQQMPTSAVARLARGAYWDAFAWEARGGKFASETSGAQFEAMKDYDSRALDDVRQAIQLNPRLAEAYRYLINIHNSNSQRDDCKRAFEEGVKVRPHSFRVRAAYMNALLPRWGGSYAAMEVLAAESEQLAAINPRLKVLRGYIPWDHGRSLPDSNLDERHKAFLEALSFGPHWLFFENLGNERAAAHHDDEALQAYFNADALVPQNARLLRKVATMLLKVKRVDEARAALAAADAFDLAGAEKNKRARIEAELLVGRGYQAYERGDSDAALSQLKQAQKKYPANAPSHYWQGRTYLKAGDFERALTEFENAVQSDPHDIESYKNIDYLLARQGKWDAIIGRWNEYLRLEPTSGEGYLERGGAYLHKGDRESALADANRACRFGSQKGCEVARRFSGGGR